MFLNFFKQPKINRIVDHLEASLAEICRDRWTYYLNLASQTQIQIEYNNHLEQEGVNPSELVNTHALFRPRDHFSWDLIPFSSDSSLVSMEKNTRRQYFFYSNLLKQVREIKHAIHQDNPEYGRILDLARSIKDTSTTLPSVVGGVSIKLNLDSLKLGGNLLFDFFSGLIGLVHAPIAAIVSLFCIPAYALSYSEYCGSPQFFLDTASYFCISLCQVISSLLFPLSMLYAKYTTDSYNIFTQCDVSRALEGIITWAEAQNGAHLIMDTGTVEPRYSV